jgi:hypothetical protein
MVVAFHPIATVLRRAGVSAELAGRLDPAQQILIDAVVLFGSVIGLTGLSVARRGGTLFRCWQANDRDNGAGLSDQIDDPISLSVLSKWGLLHSPPNPRPYLRPSGNFSGPMTMPPLTTKRTQEDLKNERWSRG